VEAALRQTHETLARLLHHEHAPLALAQRCSGVDAQAPLFTSLLNYRYAPKGQAEEGDAPGQEEAFDILSMHERTDYPLSVDVDDFGDHFSLTVQVHEQLDAARIGQFMHQAIAGLVEALQQQRPLGAIPVLSPSERHQVLHDWNGPQKAYPRDSSIAALFEARVAMHPDHPALIAEDTAL
ncbi:hypothetical protein, partial [Denitromonas iodatirespirans]